MGFCFAVSFYFSCNNKVSICNSVNYRYRVVVATAKVQIFKQITTEAVDGGSCLVLLLLPQRYKFSSKSQLPDLAALFHNVVVATAKVQIFKQITTTALCDRPHALLLLLPQRYKFSSKSQRLAAWSCKASGCCCYRKGTNFQANHNMLRRMLLAILLLLLPQRYKFSSKSQRDETYRDDKTVVVATAKVQIFKQITTSRRIVGKCEKLLLLPQRYKFSSKSQRVNEASAHCPVVVATAKVQIFKQITTPHHWSFPRF